jgi:SAM-dependent methyltransferase
MRVSSGEGRATAGLPFSAESGLYRPATLRCLSGDEVARFYANYLAEVEAVPFGAAEREYLDDPKILGRVVDPATRPFFSYHVGASIARVVTALVDGRPQPRLLELGCGSGSTALLLALAGARVIGVDSNPVAVTACRRRQAYYESHFGPLALEFHVGDALAFPYAEVAPCDGVYSVFAFNLMQPTPTLLDRLVPVLVPGGRLVLADGNRQSLVNHLLRPHPGPSPGALQAALEDRGLIVRDVRFGGLIPSALARLASTRRLAEEVETRLAPSGLLAWAAASYTLIAETQQLPQARRRPPREPRRPQRRGAARKPLMRYPNSPKRSPDRRRQRAGRGADRRVRSGNRPLGLARRPRVWGLSAGLGVALCASICAFADVCLPGNICC